MAKSSSPKVAVTKDYKSVYKNTQESAASSPGTLDTKLLLPRLLSQHYQVSYRIPVVVYRPLFVLFCLPHSFHHKPSKSNATLCPEVQEPHPFPWLTQIYCTLDMPPNFQNGGKMLSQGLLTEATRLLEPLDFALAHMWGQRTIWKMG